MAAFIQRQVIEQAEGDLHDARRVYLQMFGWEMTCNTPGAFWLWRRDFANEDAAAHARWKERGPGPLGWPSEPRPYGVITVSEELAVSMTQKSLDEQIDQDGDEATPIITQADIDRENGDFDPEC